MPYRAWYGVLVVLALAPAGLRALHWRAHRVDAVDAAMADAGKSLFLHDWKPSDPLASGDGLGPVFNAASCVACHAQGGAGGGGDLRHNVTTFTVRPVTATGQTREGVVHSFAVNSIPRDNLNHLHPQLPALPQPPRLTDLGQLPVSGSGHCPPAQDGRVRFPQGIHLSQRNTPALFGAHLIDSIPDRVIVALERTQWLASGLAPKQDEKAVLGRAMVLGNGRVGHFGWKAQTASLSDFVQAACANELGLSNPGQDQPKPLGKPGYRTLGHDLTLDQCNQLTAFCASLPRPVEKLPNDAAGRYQASAGKQMFASIGCAQCHVPDVGEIQGLYSDLLLHRMGQDLIGGGSYGEPLVPSPNIPSSDGQLADEWRTPPLWGVADSAPYLHDGRAATLEEAIRLHAGQATKSAQNFAQLSQAERAHVIAFLKTLRAPGS